MCKYIFYPEPPPLYISRINSFYLLNLHLFIFFKKILNWAILGIETVFWEVPLIANLPLGVTLLMGDSLILMVMARFVKLSYAGVCTKLQATIFTTKHQRVKVFIPFKQFLHVTTVNYHEYLDNFSFQAILFYCSTLSRLLLMSKRLYCDTVFAYYRTPLLSISTVLCCA